jgi:uncharacterized membrane protein (UPF0127 family)
MRRVLGCLLVVTALGLAGVVPRAAAAALVQIRLPSGRQLTAELMVTDEERARGLMFRDALPRDRAILFVFEEAEFESFWMKNCRFPIDMVWLDAERRVVHVAERVPPCKRDPCPSYRPLRRALYVVEMNAGQAHREKVRIGAVIDFTLPQ